MHDAGHYGGAVVAGKLVWRPGELDKLLHSPRGTVGRYLAFKGQVIMAAAKAQVGVKSGKLKASIHMRHTRTPYSQMIRIGSPLSYALAHHNGTRPHVITANRGQHLRFASGGRMVYSRQIMHPGTRPNTYLTDNLRLVK